MKVLIAGAANDTGNLGVTALGNSCISALRAVCEEITPVIQNYSSGLKNVTYPVTDGEVDIETCSIRPSRDIFSRDSSIRLSIDSKICLGDNPYLDKFKECDFVLDVAGGDSFTDLYGLKRFNAVNAIKYLAIKNKKKIILLPQTYGPFLNRKTEVEAKYLVLQAEQAWARDIYSFENLKSLLGADFNPAKHRLGVDMAFLLPVKKPSGKINPRIERWLETNERIVGINVSGLIYNDPESARKQYGFKSDYRKNVHDIINYIIENTSDRIIIVCHVEAGDNSVESDYLAAKDVAENYFSSDRLQVQPPNLDQCEIKYLIAQLDWFLGTRMHATIASLSSCVPTATISYSDKALGVFESCGQQDSVVDPRHLETDEVTRLVVNHFNDACKGSAKFRDDIRSVKDAATAQMNEISDCINA